MLLPPSRGDAGSCYRFGTADVGVFAKGGKFLYWALLGLVGSRGSQGDRWPSASLSKLG